MKFLILLTLCGQPYIVKYIDGPTAKFIRYEQMSDELKTYVNLYIKQTKMKYEIHEFQCV